MTRIVGIGDGAALQATLTRLLTQSGHDVRTAVDGSEGLQRLTEGSHEVPLRCTCMEGGTR